jgi:hypothetical protein
MPISVFDLIDPWSLEQYIINQRATEIRQENHLKRLESKPYGEWTSFSPEKDGVNINLNFFLRLLGASKEVIDDDQKTLEFMMDIKKRLDEANGVTTTEVNPNEYEDED